MHYTGLIIAIGTFVLIGVFHPIVIKVQYHFGDGVWPVFLLAGLGFVVASLFVANPIGSALLGAVGCSCLWSIGELKQQTKRVARGWFPDNPKRKKRDGKV